MRQGITLTLIVIAYLIVGGLYAIYTPDWEAPDEPAHYNYVRQLASGQLPVIEAGDYDQAYLAEVVFEKHFDPQFSIEPLEYEDWQPPLYYLLQTPLFWLSNGSLLALRLFSVFLGACVIVMAYGVCRKLFPDRPWLATGAAVFVAFLPQHLAIMASVNNDSLAELLIAGMVLVMVDMSQNRSLESIEKPGQLATLGVLLGLGFLTKGTAYPLAVVIGLVLVRQYWGKWTLLVRAGLLVFVPACLLGSTWWIRNITVYGAPDVLGKGAHDAVVTGQPLTAELVAQYGTTDAARQFVNTTFNSFWGQFGWMTVPLPSWIYRLLWIFTGLVILGLLITSMSRRSGASSPTSHAYLILGSLFVLTVGVYVGYNFTFQQHQGRYLFPALIPISIAVTISLEGWTSLFGQFRPLVHYVTALVTALLLISLDLWSLFDAILPTLG